MLQCAIRDMGVFKGFVGFDDCLVRRLWTQEQISALTFISKLLSVYLLKKRAQDRAESTAADLENILDGQDLWIYAIDSDTYSLEYINAKTHAIVPEACLLYTSVYEQEGTEGRQARIFTPLRHA